ncbi:hypothetical protein Tco_1278950 [Tanacetum coccineum]
MVGAGHAAYTDRFHELARLVHHLVTPESRKIERYVYGLAPQIRGMVAATEPKTMQKAVKISGALIDEAVRNGSIKKVDVRNDKSDDLIEINLQAKNKDLENVVCKMGKSTETLWLLINEQKAFRDNLRKSGLGYNGPYVLSQAYAKIPALYRAYELCNKNEQLHVFDSDETLEDAEKSQLKMNEFQKDEKFRS